MSAYTTFVGGGFRRLARPNQGFTRCFDHALQTCRNYCNGAIGGNFLGATCLSTSNRHVGRCKIQKAPCVLSNVRASSLVLVRSFNSPRRQVTEENDTEPTRKEQEKDDSGMLVRFNNENGYLSWCRNCYLATTAGALISNQDTLVANAKEVGTLIIFLGGLNLLNGTASYLYFLVQLKRQGRIGLAAALVQVTLASIHILLWLVAMAIYIGVVEEDPQLAETEVIEIFSNEPRSKRDI